jgi:hypothetical protein
MAFIMKQLLNYSNSRLTSAGLMSTIEEQLYVIMSSNNEKDDLPSQFG